MSTDETGADPPVLSDGDCDRLWRMLSEPSADLPLAALDRAVERMRTAEGKLAEVRETAETFLAHYGHSELLSFKVALDLAHGVLQVLDREPLESNEEKPHA